MTNLFSAGKRRWLAIFPLMGLIVLIVLVKLKPSPALKADVQLSPKVLVATAEVRPLKAVIKGYGRARSKETWQAVSEVSGRVIYRHPDLEKGAMLSAGTVALKIDPVDYQLKLAQARSDLNSAKADADRIELNRKKIQVMVELESNRLAIMEKELKRKQGLLTKGSISRSSVDQEQSNVYAQRQKVVDLQTSLKLIPNDIEVAKARIQVNQSKLEQAQRQLDKTQVVIPFDARIVDVNAELEQVVNVQQVLIKANHMGTMQIPAQFSFADMKRLVRQSIGDTSLSNGDSFPDIRLLNLGADIRLYAGDKVHHWQGKVVRVSDTMDVQGNTVELLVEMENDWHNFNPIKRPPMLNDMFVEVNVSSKAKSVLSMPSAAVHGDSVYQVVESKLRIKPVKVLFESGPYVAIDRQAEGTIKAGDTVIVTDVLPAIDGMAVRSESEQVQ